MPANKTNTRPTKVQPSVHVEPARALDRFGEAQSTTTSMKLKKIVCPTDFSKASRRALRVGADLAARDDGQLCLVHILEVEPAVVTDPNFVMLVPEYERTLHADAQRQLDALAASVKKVKVATIVGHGDPGNEIVRIAEEEDADLIAMSTHGRTGLKRVVLGSVAEKVVRNAGRPVLTLPAASK